MSRFELTCRHGGQIFPHHKGPGRPREALLRLRRAATGGVLLAFALAGGGCGTTGFADDDQLVTGSITPQVKPVSAPLPEGAAPKGIGDADWTEAKLALEQALAARQKDASIPWENRASGARGTATPIGEERAGGCRDFIISVVQANAADRWIQGTACRPKGADAKGALVLSQVRMLGRA